MAGDRTLKLSILADISNLAKELNKGAKDVEGFGTQIANISEKAVKAFAAIGLAVGAASIAFAKAAAEDEQSANKLAQTIETVTKATNTQIAAVEEYIKQTSLATGITDDQLRPAYERLIRSTKDVENATKLLNLALDLSAATGKPLELIVNALGRAYDGNVTALGRLGLGIDAALLKSKDFNAIYEYLNSTFGEFSEKRSEEALVKFQRLQVAFEEAKESIGAALLPAFERLGDWLLNEGVPRLNAFIAGLVGDRSLSSSFTQTQRKSEEFGIKVREVIDTFIKYKDVVVTAAAVTLTVFAISKIAAGVTATIALIRSLILAYNALKASAVVAAVATAAALNPLLGAAAGAGIFAALGLAAKKLSDMDNDNLPSAPTYNELRQAQIAGSTLAGGLQSGTSVSVSGGGTGAGLSGVTTKPAPSLSRPITIQGNPNITDQAMNNLGYRPFSAEGNPNITNNITVNGAIDPASTARQIADILNGEAANSGSLANLGLSRFAQRVS